MPDPWEYPWFAAWDLAFHAIPWAHLDPAFAKYQLTVLLREWFLHPNGALPAYEWNFDDVNPPVHALAAIRVFVIDGSTDTASSSGSSRSCCSTSRGGSTARTPTATTCSGAASWAWTTSARSTGPTSRPTCGSSRPTGRRGWPTTPWRCWCSPATLAERNHVYDDMVVKFLEHFVLISDSLEASGLLDPDDGFFYDRLIDAHGNATPIQVQSLVGVLPGLPAASLSLAESERSRACASVSPAVSRGSGAREPRVADHR